MKSHVYEYENERMDDEALDSLWLPSREVWLKDPRTQKIDTPTDDRGLIKIPQLIQDVKDTIDPSYTWSGPTSDHHLYWPSAAYPRWESPLYIGDPAAFCNLPINIARVPRIFENWLHKITRPSEVPPVEIMAIQVEAWRVATGLFIAARRASIHERRAQRRRTNIANGAIQLREEFDGVDILGEEYIQEEFEKNFGSWQHLQERNSRLPEEFRIHGIEHSRPEELATALGRIVRPKALYLVPNIAA
jgi:hypothetical protein